jgi:fimbrial isopeptide formation D2 family protein/LPXTG-motif cell wall-anchored protein
MKRRILPILLSAALAFAMPFTSFAAEGDGEETTQVSTPQEAESVEHQYKAYQIFTFEIGTDGQYYNAEWGSDATDAVKAAIASLVTPTDAAGNVITAPTAQDYAVAIHKAYPNATYTTAGEGAEILAAEISKTVSGDGLAVTNKKIAGNETGYYLIVDVTQALADTKYDVYLNRSQLQVFIEDGEVNIVDKHKTIEIDKKVVDTNDSTDPAFPSPIKVDYDGWEETADYDIGDSIPFQIIGTLPDDLSYYTTYEYTFNDKQSTGLVFQENTVHVYLNNTDNEITKEGNYTVTVAEDKHSFQVKFANIKTVTTDANAKIILQYESILTGEGVVFGNPGNPNEARIEFSNDKGGKGQTPWDIAIVFSFKPIINKVDQNNVALKGATFTLEKLRYDGDLTNKENWAVLKTQTIKGDDTTTFTFDGIDDGYYRISEIAPANYNAIEPMYFVVEADHDATNKLTRLSVYDLEGKVLGSSTEAEKQVSLGTFDIPQDLSEIEADIINQQGTVLPSTGGIGTTIFYVIGGVLVAGAVVLLIVRRRMRNEEE